MKSVAVYCGHQMGKNPEFAREAKVLGKALAYNGIRLVFGGGNVGLMGTVASAALENGGEVIGVSTPNVTARQEPVHEGIKIEMVPGLNERKQRMFELSDAFCILPGGIGTLNELTDIMTMQQVGESKKPIFFLNSSKYWDVFGQILVHMQQEGFIESMQDYEISIFSTAEELVDKITGKNN